MRSISMLDSSQSNTVVITTVDVLKSAFLEWADEMIQAHKKANEDVMIDEAAVIHRLQKSRSTLWRWNASDYLPCYKLGGKNRYKLSDVERIEKGIAVTMTTWKKEAKVIQCKTRKVILWQIRTTL